MWWEAEETMYRDPTLEHTRKRREKRDKRADGYPYIAYRETGPKCRCIQKQFK